MVQNTISDPISTYSNTKKEIGLMQVARIDEHTVLFPHEFMSLSNFPSRIVTRGSAKYSPLSVLLMEGHGKMDWSNDIERVRLGVLT